MIIKTLVENTSVSEDFNSEHGLSLYLETKKHKILFDFGKSNLFIENAKKMNVDLSEVDLAVISHGHYDHGGGLKAFLEMNDQAKIYLNKKAFNQYYANRPGGKKEYIGLDQALKENNRLIYVDDYLVIDDELQLFSNVLGRKMYPSGNKDLFIKVDNQYILDDFGHEQNMIIAEDNHMVLIAGCAHNGIVNIIEHINKKDIYPSHVIGGFHLYNPSKNINEEPRKVMDIAKYLESTGSMYYTCHCTGIESYNILKDTLGKKIDYLSTGSLLKI